MKIKKLLVIISILATAGLIFFAVKKSYIILNFSSSVATQTYSIASNNKKVTLYYWKNNQWHQEEVSLFMNEHTYNTVYHLVSQYLQLLQDESISKQKTTVQQVLVNYDKQEIFVSFDRIPWHKESCTHEKLMIIEGILKTIKGNEPSIKKIRFLVNHQPMIDTHLDFSNAWPIDGFLTA